MYIPKSFEVSDVSVIEAFIHQNSFGVIVSRNDRLLEATHIPFLFDSKRNVLVGHFAKANKQWTSTDSDILVIFQGPNAYISPSWYKEKNTVPTWNYLAVHVYGKLNIYESSNKIVEILKQTVEFYEGNLENPWEPDWADDFIISLTNHVVAFEVAIEKIEAKWKLNQNHSLERQERVIEGLMKTGDHNSQLIAGFMRNNIEDNSKS